MGVERMIFLQWRFLLNKEQSGKLFSTIVSQNTRLQRNVVLEIFIREREGGIMDVMDKSRHER